MKSPPTRPTLLIRIRDQADGDAWNDFVDIYAPLIHAYGCKQGLQDADAADLAQRTLQSVARAIADFDYDSAKGSFRGWLFTISRNHYLKTVKDRQRQAKATGNSGVARMLEQLPDDSYTEEEWGSECQKRILVVAMDKAKNEFEEKTWQAFRRSVFDGETAKAVADSLGLSIGAVYIARSRVKARLRQIVDQIQE